MITRRFDSTHDIHRTILISMATDPEVLGRMAEAGLNRPFASDFANIISNWLVRHWQKFHEPPGPAGLLCYARDYLENRPDSDKVKDAVDDFLTSLDDFTKHQKELPSAGQVLEMAEKFIKKRMASELADFASNGHADSPRLAELMTRYQSLDLTSSQSQAADLWELLRLDDLLSGEDPPQVPYLIPGVLTQGQPCLIAGNKKSLKTTLCLDLGVSLAACRPFLGLYQPSEPARVMMLSSESGEATLEKDFFSIWNWKTSRHAGDRSGSWRPLPPSWVDGDFALVPKVPRLDNAADLQKVEELLDDHGTDVLILDNAKDALPGDAMSNLYAVGEHLKGITEMCRARDVTLVMVCHTKKEVRYTSPPQLEDISWAGLQEWARQWLLIDRRSPFEAGPPRQHRLWLNVGGSAGHGFLSGVDVQDRLKDGRPCWKVRTMSGGDAYETSSKQPHKGQSTQTKIMDHLTDHPSGDTARGIQKKKGINASDFRSAIKELVDLGQVEAADVLKNKRREKGYKTVGATD